MASAGDLSGVDMNDPVNLKSYSQVLLFKDDIFRNEVVFVDRSNPEQRTLQTIAHSLDLVYEYSAATRIIRISRPAIISEDIVYASWTPISDEVDLETSRTTIPMVIGSDAPTSIELDDTHRRQSEADIPPHMGNLPDNSDLTLQLDGVEEAHRQPEYPVNELQYGFVSSYDVSFPEVCSSCMFELPNCCCLENALQLSEQIQSITEPRATTYDADSGQRSLSEKMLQDKTDTHHAIFETASEFNSRSPIEKPAGVVAYSVSENYYKQVELLGYNEYVTSFIDQFTQRDQTSYCEPLYYPELSLDNGAAVQSLLSGFDKNHVYSGRSTGHKRKRAQCLPSPAPPLIAGAKRCKEGVTQRNQADYEEIVFDSRSNYSGSQDSAGSGCSFDSGGSGRSGRRGPLSHLAKADMRAVKDIKACWRCKAMRKKCGTENPCLLCVKDHEDPDSMWAAVGCRRGDFNAPSFALCRPSPISWPIDNDGIEAAEAKYRSMTSDSKVEAWLEKGTIGDASAVAEQTLPPEDIARELFIQHFDTLPAFSRYQIRPTQQLGLTVIWYLHHNSLCQVLNPHQSLEKLMRILPTAIAYQYQHKTNDLITQSLTCLKVCAQVLHAKASGLLDPQWHIHREEPCQITSLIALSQNLNLCLSKYFRALSATFFTARNLRSCGSWFLSAVYSFAIQSYVRQILIQLWSDENAKAWEDFLANRLTIQRQQHDQILQDTPIKLAGAYGWYVHGRKGSRKADMDTGLSRKQWHVSWQHRIRDRKLFLRDALSISMDNLMAWTSWDSSIQQYTKTSQSEFEHALTVSVLFEDNLVGRMQDKVADPQSLEASQYMYLPLHLLSVLSRNGARLYPWASSDSWLNDNKEAYEAVGLTSDPAAGFPPLVTHLKDLFQYNDGVRVQEAATATSSPRGWGGSDNGECAVCLGPMLCGDNVSATQCSHRGHTSCMVAWLQETNICPSCTCHIYRRRPRPLTCRYESCAWISESGPGMDGPFAQRANHLNQVHGKKDNANVIANVAEVVQNHEASVLPRPNSAGEATWVDH